MVRILGRDQVAWLAAVAAVFQVVTAYGFDVSGHVQGIVSAVVIFVFAVANAIHVHDGVIALVVGIMNALFALFTAFNLHMTADQQTLWVGAVTAVLALFVRTQVTAPVPPEVSPAGVLVAPKTPQA